MLLEVLANKTAVLYWFTFDDQGQQRYLNAVGNILGNRIVFPKLFETMGGRFIKPGIAPEFINIGQAELLFSNCDNGRLSFRVHGVTGYQDPVRLTDLMGYPCGIPKPGPPVTGDMIQSGAWNNTSRGNHGLIVEVLPSTDVLAYWFTYGTGGKQQWIFGVGNKTGPGYQFSQLYTTADGIFAAPAEQAEAELLPWGSMSLELNCDKGTLTYNADDPTIGTDSIPLKRLTFVGETTCPGP
jgi:hypothetical protein